MKKSHLLVAALVAITSIQSTAASAKLKPGTVRNVIALEACAYGYSINGDREVTAHCMFGGYCVDLYCGSCTPGLNAQEIHNLCPKVPVQNQNGGIIPPTH